MKLSNLLSLFRVALFPFIIYFIYQETVFYLMLALLLLFLILVSDFVNTYLVQKNKIVSSFLDPFTDKVVITSLLLVFALRGSFWWSVVLFFISRDLLAGLFRWLGVQDNFLIQERWPNTILTYLQYVLLSGLLTRDLRMYGVISISWLEKMDLFIILITGFAVVVATVSLFYYVSIYLKGIRKKRASGQPLTKEKMVILANRKARGYHDAYRRRLLQVFAKRRGAQVDYLPAKKLMFQDAERKVKDAKQLIIAGGDGSFESALNYKPFAKKSLGFFPLGAGNAFYSYFYRGKRFEYLRSRFQFREVQQDVMELEWGGGKVQTLFLSAGIDAAALHLVKKRTQHGFFDYLQGSWRALCNAKADYDFHVSLDDKEQVWANCVNVTLAKIPYYGFGLRSLLQLPQPDDGNVYGLAVINTHSSFLNKPLRLWALLLTTFGMEKAPLLPFQGEHITITSKVPFPVQAGGEFLGYTHFIKVKVKRKQKVLMI